LLENWILEDLAKSGLTPENFAIEPIIDEKQIKERLGFSMIKDDNGNWVKIFDVGGYWVKYPNVENYYRLKLKQKIGDSKYLSPKGRGNHPYVLPEVKTISTMGKTAFKSPKVASIVSLLIFSRPC